VRDPRKEGEGGGIVERLKKRKRVLQR